MHVSPAPFHDIFSACFEFRRLKPFDSHFDNMAQIGRQIKQLSSAVIGKRSADIVPSGPAAKGARSS